MVTMFIVSALLKLLSGLGLAYIIWILAAKESGTVKTIGIVLSILIVIFALISALYGMSPRGMHREFGPGKDFTNQSTTEKSNAATPGAAKTTHVWKKHIAK